jgi:carbonic anhydrase/acetyltransferase-like protein (isoleucine patch superfamily)
MIQEYMGKRPRFDAGVRAHDTAVIIGDVSLSEGVSLWPHCVLRGDYNFIRVGKGSNVQDGAVIHNDHKEPCEIGEDCVIGHLACVHGARVGNRCLIGIHATLLNGSVIGDECIIGAGALIPEGKVIPPRSLVLGSPGKILRLIREDELERILEGAKNYRAYAERQLPLLS